MNLAARCPECGTLFRVVQDQLRVSEGWVRCGRCAAVFNALETLVDLDAGSTEAPAVIAPQRGTEPAPLQSPPAFEDQATVVDELSLPPPPAPQPAPPPEAEPWPVGELIESDPPPPVPPEPLVPEDAAPLAPPIDGATEEAPVEPAADYAEALEAPAAGEAPAPAPGETLAPAEEAAAPEAAEPVPTPAFIRDAERAERWRSSRARATLAGGCAGLLLLLVAQVLFTYRDLAAARWPGLRGPLEQVCAVAGCRVEAPRSIEALSVESSGLVQVPGTRLVRLSVVLRNRAAIALALPAFDLTLTDTQGRVIARRVLTTQDLGHNARTVAAGAELPLQATLGTAERTVSGYTIEIFYP